MHAYSHAFPHAAADHDDMDEEATVVCPSPYLAMIADQAEAEARQAEEAQEFGYAESGVIPASRTKLAKGYPSTPVQHTFTEPLRGYPQAAAFVPRHEETGVFCTEEDDDGGYGPTMVMMSAATDADTTLPPTQAMPAVQPAAFAPTMEAPVYPPYQSQPSLPPTMAMPAFSAQSAAPAPSYGHNVVALPVVAPEATQPLVADAGGVSYANQNQSPAYFAAPIPTPAPPAGPSSANAAPSHAPATQATKELRGGRALFGALLGAILGAILWGGVGWLTGGYEFKYGAILIGLFTGVGAAQLGGGHSKGVGALGAVFGLAGILTGKALFEILVQPHLSLGEHIAYHATPIDLVFYGATIVTGFAVGAGTLAPQTIFRRGRYVLRRFLPFV